MEITCTHKVNATARQKLFMIQYTFKVASKQFKQTPQQLAKQMSLPVEGGSFLPKVQQLKGLVLRAPKSLKQHGSLAATPPSWRSAPLKSTACRDAKVCLQAANLKNFPRDFRVSVFIPLIICL